MCRVMSAPLSLLLSCPGLLGRWCSLLLSEVSLAGNLWCEGLHRAGADPEREVFEWCSREGRVRSRG